jgi:excisionase family DNA binding protein
MPDYLTVVQVAEWLQLSEKTVYHLAQQGVIPGFKVGGSWRFRRRDIDGWSKEQIRVSRGARPFRRPGARPKCWVAPTGVLAMK